MEFERGQDRAREWRAAVAPALRVADRELLALEVDVLDAQAQGFEQAQAVSVEQGRGEAGNAFELA